MAPYDSDSSEGEDGDYTETNVLLGYASKEPSEDTISHIGGRPTWLDPSTPPSAALAKCKVCNDLMVLLLQLNGDLPEVFPGHERRLYVLTCRRKTCRRKEGSVKALRGIRITAAVSPKEKSDKNNVLSQQQEQASKPAVNIGETLFGAQTSPAASPFANPFSTSTSNSNPSNPFSNPFSTTSSTPSEKNLDPEPTDHISTTSKNDPSKFGPAPPPEPWPEESKQPPAYPLYYLADADYEVLDKVEELPVPTETLDYDEGPSSSRQKEDKDVYESTIDKTFQKFADRLAQNPEQVIRYEFKGQPLLYSKHDTVGKLLSSGEKQQNGKVTTTSGSSNGMPRCGSCGAGRVFEVQLTPHAIMELESQEIGIDGMEWGTIIVGVCERDCQQRNVADGVGYVEEWVGVQWEELSVRK
ncbi:hypothetical protein B7463_g3810, partial [Scytalidium lignicola]